MTDRNDRLAAEGWTGSSGIDLSGFLDSITDGCFALARDWTVTYLNRACAEYVGRDRAEIVGRSVWESHSALLGSACEQQLRQAMEERTPRRVELESALHPGRQIELRIFPTAAGLAVVLRDITVERAHKAALQEKETRFRVLTDLVPAFVWIARPDGGLQFLNDRWYEFSGQTPQQALPNGWTDVLHPDDRARTRTAWQDAVARGAHYEIEVRYRRHDGAYRWYVARAEPLCDAAGAITGWFGTSTDIHDNKLIQQALRESEARFRNLADHAPVMIWVTEADGRSAYLSRRWCEFTGQTPEAAQGSGALDPVHPDDRDELVRVFSEANARREPFRLDYRLRRADGEWRWAIGAGAPRFGDDGSFLGYVGSVIDITERKQAEERLKRLAREVDHRAKNILALVQVMIRQTRATSVEEFVRVATGRLYALGRAHTLLAQARWSGADLDRLIQEELALFRAGPKVRAQVSGPPVKLGPEAAQSLAMTLHELTTNAIKHGALSVPDGVIAIEWTGGAGAPLVLRWSEKGGPPVSAPRRSGIGLDVIKRIAADQLGGGARFDWRPEGLVCDVIVPADKLVSEGG